MLKRTHKTCNGEEKTRQANQRHPGQLLVLRTEGAVLWDLNPQLSAFRMLSAKGSSAGRAQVYKGNPH